MSLQEPRDATHQRGSNDTISGSYSVLRKLVGTIGYRTLASSSLW